jgi:hypothetical protein
MIETSLLICNSIRILIFNYIVGYFTFNSMNGEGLVIMLVILLLSFFLTLILILKQLKEGGRQRS